MLHTERSPPSSLAVTSPTLTFRRKLLYAAMTAVLFVGVGATALELGLRLFGYGYSAHFTRRERLATGEAIWRENRWCTAPYFSPALVRRPQPFVLPEKKAPGTYRIFVLGSSAAMGDPDASFSLARMLDILLRAAYPERRFEVINAGITAINSHVVRSIAEDCAALQPDLFIVYEGNNEVIGPFGPSGVFAPFLKSEGFIRGLAWAKTTRTGQLFGALGRAAGGERDAPKDWAGMQMFLRQQIAATDPRLDSVRGHFAANLLSIAQSAHQAGATTLLCTVVTNARDFAPFMSQHRANLSSVDLAAWESHWATATAAQRAGNLAQAENELRQALAIDDQYAELPFRLGRLLLQSGQDIEAQPLLQRALDFDTLRFRTDSTLNQVVRDVAAYAPETTLIDLAQELANASPHGVAGDELLYEHVHLTFRGTYEAATRLLPRIAVDLQRRGLASGTLGKPLTIDEARQRLGFTTYEQAMIGLELLQRFRTAPFVGQADNATRLAAWERRVETAKQLLNRPEATDALLAVYRQALATSPDDWMLARNAGAMLVARGRPADAVPLLDRARAIIPDDADTLVALGLAHRALGHASEATAIFTAARQLEPRHPLLPKE